MQAILDQSIQILREGFTQINDPKGLLIALAATLFMRTWGQWIPAAVVSTVLYVAIEHFAPILAGRGELVLPPLTEAGFWGRVGVLFVGFLLVIAVFFFVKRILQSAAGGGGKGKH